MNALASSIRTKPVREHPLLGVAQFRVLLLHADEEPFSRWCEQLLGLRAALDREQVARVSAFAESGWNRLLRATSSVLLAEPGPIGEEPIRAHHA